MIFKMSRDLQRSREIILSNQEKVIDVQKRYIDNLRMDIERLERMISERNLRIENLIGDINILEIRNVRNRFIGS